MPGIETATGGVTYGTGDYYNYILNNLFLPSMADAVIYPNTLLKRLPRDSTRVEGKNVVFPIHYDDANGVVSIGADGLLPEPDSEKFAQYSFPVKHTYVRMKFDGISRDASRTQIASWLKIVESEAKAKSLIMARAKQRMAWEDGSGRLAEIATYGSPGVYTCQLNQDIDGSTTCVTSPTRHLKVGKLVAIVSPAGVLRAIGKVESKTAVGALVLETSGSYTVEESGTVPATGDWIVSLSQFLTIATLNAAVDTAYLNEPMGIMGIVADANAPLVGTPGTFQGIDSEIAGNDWHQANVLSNSNVLRPLTTKLMDLAWTTGIEIGDAVPTVLYGSFPMVREYADLLVSQRYFQGTMSFDGGYDAVPYNGVPFFADRDSYNNQITFLDETDIRSYVMSDPQWMDMDGSIYHRVTDKDAYQATMFERCTIGNDERHRHTKVVDIQE